MNITSTVKKITIAATAGSLLFMITACNNNSDKSEIPFAFKENEEIIFEIEFELNTEKQISLLDATKKLLDENGQSYTEQSGYLSEICGLPGTDTHGWMFYNNGEAGEVGASDVVLKEGDSIEWKYVDYAAIFG